MELIILGAGPAYSDIPGSLGSAYLLRSDAGSIALDLGQGTFPSLASLLDPTDLSGVVISHLHPDHFIDLIPLRHYLRRAEATSDRRLSLHAADGILQRLDGAWGSAGFAATAFDHQSLADGQRDIGPYRVEAVRVRHSPDSYAVRASLRDGDGAGLVYTGDIAEAVDAEPLVRPGDVVLSEASYGPGPVPDGMPHIDAKDAAELAARTGASQLLLTHVRIGTDLEATMRSARASFDGPASLVRPGARFSL